MLRISSVKVQPERRADRPRRTEKMLTKGLSEQQRRADRAVQAAEEARRCLADLERALRRNGEPEPEVLTALGRMRHAMEEVDEVCDRSHGRSVACLREVADGMTDELERSRRLARLGELAASVAHEIRNPLCGMMLSLDVFQTKLDPDDSRLKLLRNARHETEKMEKIVANLLHFARDYQPRMGRCAMRSVLHSTIESVRTQLDKKGVRVEVNGAPEADANADPELLQQVFRNLLLNAVDADPDLHPIEVNIGHDTESALVCVTVRDQGEGMTPERLERIFEPFFTSKAKGTGLGLAVSRKIVEAHGGRIEVESEPGRGSTFSVVLPAAQPAGAAACAGC